MFQLSKALKDLPTRVQSSSLNVRREVIQTVIQVLPHPGAVLWDSPSSLILIDLILGITEAVVRGICRVVQITLVRYRDGASRALIKDLITALVKQHPKFTAKNFVPVLIDVAEQHKNLIATYVIYCNYYVYQMFLLYHPFVFKQCWKIFYFFIVEGCKFLNYSVLNFIIQGKWYFHTKICFKNSN